MPQVGTRLLHKSCRSWETTFTFNSTFCILKGQRAVRLSSNYMWRINNTVVFSLHFISVMQTHICAIFVHLGNDAEFIDRMCFFNNWRFVSVISLNIVETVCDCGDISPITTACATEDVGVGRWWWGCVWGGVVWWCVRICVSDRLITYSTTLFVSTS